MIETREAHWHPYESDPHEEPESTDDLLEDAISFIRDLIAQAGISREDVPPAILRALDIGEDSGNSIGPDFRLALYSNLAAGRQAMEAR